MPAAHWQARGSDMHLTPAELVAWTDCKTPQGQAAALDAMGVRYHLSPAGRVKTTWEAINHSLIGQRKAGDGFNLEAARGRENSIFP